MKKLLIAFPLILVASGAMALDLAGARAAGAVCEQPDGYVKALRPEGTGVAAQVNAGRKAEYARIGQQNNQTVEVAGKIAAPQILASGAKACQ